MFEYYTHTHTYTDDKWKQAWHDDGDNNKVWTHSHSPLQRKREEEKKKTSAGPSSNHFWNIMHMK